MYEPIPDPWRPDQAAPDGTTRSSVLRHLAVVLLGASGVAAAVWSHGPDGLRGAIGIVIASAGWSALLRTQSPIRWWGLPAAAAVLAAGALLTVPYIGRAPILITIAATTVAHGAMVGLAPRARVRPGPAPVAVLAVPPLAVAQVLSYRMAPTAVVLALVGTAGVLLALQRHRPERFAPVASSIDRLARAVGSGALHAVMLLVALPLIYLPGAVVRLGRKVGRGRGPDTGWAEPSTLHTQQRDARYPFSSPPPRVALVRHVGAALVVALVLGVVLVQWDGGADVPGFPTSGSSDPSSNPGGPADDERSLADRLDAVAFSDRPALAGVPFADELQAETYDVELIPDDITGYGLADREGELVNVVDGVRVTSSSDCDGCPKARVFLVGGSLVFGIGSRDAHTIPSELVAVAAADGIALEVVNIAVPGWTLTQEQAAVERWLDEPGSAPPDLVVFLDGYNDTLSTLMDLVFDGSIPPTPALLDGVKAEKLLDREGGFGDFPGDEYGRMAAARYQESSRPFDAMLESRGIGVARFFQPDASSTPAQRAAVDALEVLPADFYETTQMDRVLGASAAELDRDGDSVDLRSTFDDLEDPVFIDTAHVNEVGAAMLAEVLYGQLRAEIRSAAG